MTIRLTILLGISLVLGIVMSNLTTAASSNYEPVKDVVLGKIIPSMLPTHDEVIQEVYPKSDANFTIYLSYSDKGMLYAGYGYRIGSKRGLEFSYHITFYDKDGVELETLAFSSKEHPADIPLHGTPGGTITFNVPTFVGVPSTLDKIRRIALVKIDYGETITVDADPDAAPWIALLANGGTTNDVLKQIRSTVSRSLDEANIAIKLIAPFFPRMEVSRDFSKVDYKKFRMNTSGTGIDGVRIVTPSDRYGVLAWVYILPPGVHGQPYLSAVTGGRITPNWHLSCSGTGYKNTPWPSDYITYVRQERTVLGKGQEIVFWFAFDDPMTPVDVHIAFVAALAEPELQPRKTPEGYEYAVSPGAESLEAMFNLERELTPNELFLHAIKTTNTNFIESALKKGADPKQLFAKSFTKVTAIGTRYFYDYGPPLGEHVLRNMLLHSIDLQDTNLIDYAIEKGADIAETPVLEECFNQPTISRQIVEYCLSKGANAKLKAFDPPLVVLCDSRNTRLSDDDTERLAARLLDSGADINKPKRDGKTALDGAISQKKTKTALLLINRGATIVDKDALITLATKNQLTEIIARLQQNPE